MPKFSLKKLTKEQKYLRKRIIELSHSAKLAHLGSCLSAIDLINEIYKVKKGDEQFILSNGHAGIAWYVILEKYGFLTEKQIKALHIHPDRHLPHDIHVSTGSLGQGLPIALGMAIATPKKNIYCMLSDGECAEGSIWEALRVAYENNIHNLKIIINANGWSAYDKVNLSYLKKRIRAFGYDVQKVDGNHKESIQNAMKKLKTKKLTVLFAHTVSDQLPFLKGQDAHYYVMSQDDYDFSIKVLT